MSNAVASPLNGGNGRSSNEPVTLMLVGGGIRFPAFIGALQAIEELGLNITKVIASSTASIIAGMYLCGSSPQKILEKTLALDTRQFKDASLKSIVTGYGLCSGRRLEEWIDRELEGATFSRGMKVPLEIIATDMMRYRPVTFSAEKFPDIRISEAATASSLVPGVFGYKKLQYNGKRYALIDGSLMTGVVEGRMDKNQKVLVIKMMSKRTLKRHENGSLSPLKYFHEMLTFSMHAQEKEFLKGGKWKDTIIIYCSEIPPATFSITADEKNFLYEQGYEQTKKYLEYKWGFTGGSK
ncbi:MAG: patatin-like phospholipase family protein [Geobacteraceae bacterium]|nr:patatin-like phospholipase family protein [Geobacteraceae bacterium]